ncbi:hypothetical protein P3T36_002753 [Kitasatospora sp. MAP12-15]|uniref:RNA ligase family protein n=1 Tax=unclassified Kitasatospora TaxID=2633591 RepID=UPI00247382EC|nr:RNA ligase family protein [Kitasatospora sp. MAP12-44]MDH6113932.1 hypothetical protein [Kitasatospora sp. MAP12-44]
MEPYSPYPKIPERQGLSNYRAQAWAVTEKAHGAHVAVNCRPDGSVLAASRKRPLGSAELDGFFGLSRIWPQLSVAAQRYAALLRGHYGPDAEVTVFGELAGGHYPHPDVPAVPGYEPVQTGVWYSPRVELLMFDTAVDTAGDRVWISQQRMRDAAVRAGLLCVPLLAVGPLHRVQGVTPGGSTLIPALLGLPAIPDNRAEGIVVAVAEEWRGEARPQAKAKIDRFAEDSRYDGSRPYAPPPDGAAGLPAWLLAEAVALLAPARAAAAVSKLGPGVPLDAVAQEIVADALADLDTAVGGLAEHAEPCRRALIPAARVLAQHDAEDRATRRL